MRIRARAIPPATRHRAVPLAALALAGLSACLHLGGARPLFGPVPGSFSLVLDGQPEAVIAAAAGEVQRAGLVVLRSAPDEGYLETQWYDVATQRTVSPRARDLDHTVKVRLFADPAAGKTRLAAECVVRIADDPSEPPRDLERMVADSTPGHVLLDSLVARLKVIFPPPPPADTSTKPRP